MSNCVTRPVALLDWDEAPLRVFQAADWKLNDQGNSTNRLTVTTTLAEAKGVRSEQELIFKGRRFAIDEIDSERADGLAELKADEVQAELKGHTIESYEVNSWTLPEALGVALEGTRWTMGEVQGTRYGRSHFDDITVLDALKFLARHQDARLSFDSLRRRVNITPQAGKVHEIVFTYGRQLSNIRKVEKAPRTTVIHPTGADGLTVASAVLDDGEVYGSSSVEDYGYYLAQGMTLAEARTHRKEEYWQDSRYTEAENLLRDAQARLAEEAYPQITYTLTAAATTSADDSDDFDLGTLRLGDQVYVWDNEIAAKLRAEVTEVTTSSNATENRLTLAYLPESLNNGVESSYFGDSGRPADGPDQAISVPQPRPSMPILVSIDNLGNGKVRWNGQDEDGEFETIPERFGTLETRAAKLLADGSIPSPDSEDAFSGTLIDTRGGGVSSVSFGEAGEYAVWFRIVSRNGQTLSPWSEPLVIDAPELVDSEEIRSEVASISGRVGEGLQTTLTAALTSTMANLKEFRDEWDSEWDPEAMGALEKRQRDLASDLSNGLQGLQDSVDGQVSVVENLFVGSSDNLFADPLFQLLESDGSPKPGGQWRMLGRAGGWRPYEYSSIGWTLRSHPDWSGGASTYAIHLPHGKGIAVRPGEEYVLDMTAWRSSGSNGLVRIRWYFIHEDGSTSDHIAFDLGNSVQEYSDELTVPDDALIRYMGVEFARASGATGDVQIREVNTRKKTSGRVLIDGTVGARQVNSKELTADKAFLDAAMVNLIQGRLAEFDEAIIGGVLIKEGALNASHIIVGNPENMIPDPKFKTGWWDGLKQSFKQTSTAKGPDALNFSPSKIDADGGEIRLSTRFYDVVPGAKYAISFETNRYGANSAGDNDNYNLWVRIETPNGGWYGSAMNVSNFASSGWEKKEYTFTIPDNVEAGRWHAQWRIQDLDGGSLWVSNPQMRQMVGAVNIEDGAITAPKIDVNDLAASEARMEILFAGMAKFSEAQIDNLLGNSAKFKQIEGAVIMGGRIEGADVIGSNVTTASSIYGDSPGGARMSGGSSGGEFVATRNGSTIFRAGYNGAYFAGDIEAEGDIRSGTTSRYAWLKGPDSDYGFPRLELKAAAGYDPAYLGMGTDNDQTPGGLTVLASSREDGGHDRTRLALWQDGNFSLGRDQIEGVHGDRNTTRVSGRRDLILETRDAGGEVRIGTNASNSDATEGFIAGRHSSNGAYSKVYTRTGSYSPNVYQDGNFIMYRSTSLEENKIDIDRYPLVDLGAVKQLAPTTFRDRGEMERGGNPPLQIGLIAQDVEELGLTVLNTWDEDGSLLGVAYDRVPEVLILWNREQETRLDDLEARVNAIGGAE